MAVKPHVPELFTLLIEVDNKVREVCSQHVVPFETHKLVAEKKKLIKAAENMLRWNHNKGNTS